MGLSVIFPECMIFLFRDISRGENRRFVNEELDACIIKYCLRQEAHGHGYMGDADDDDVTESMETPGNTQRMCAFIACGHTTNPQALYQCVQAKCDASPVDPSDDSNPASSDPDAFLHVDICALTECKGRHGTAYLDCMEQRCSLQLEEAKGNGKGMGEKKDENLLSSDFPVARKRRVNDPMPLCIKEHSLECASSNQFDKANCLAKKCM